MIMRWFQTWMRGRLRADESIFEEETESFHGTKLVDVAHAVLSKEAVEKSRDLGRLERWGGILFRQRRLKRQIRAKVKQSLKLPYVGNNEEMIDEITEKITEVAAMDRRVGRWFDDTAD